MSGIPYLLGKGTLGVKLWSQHGSPMCCSWMSFSSDLGSTSHSNIYIKLWEESAPGAIAASSLLAYASLCSVTALLAFPG